MRRATTIGQEQRVFDLRELRALKDELIIRGHAAVFHVLADLGRFREQIAAGAFAQSIQEDDIRALWNHDTNIVLGRNRAGTLTLAEDARGLAMEIRVPDTSWGRDAVATIESGNVTQASFAFDVRPGGERFDVLEDGTHIRTLTALKLWEVSPVTFPAYEETDVAMRSYDAFRATLPPPAAAVQRELRQRMLESDVRLHG